MWATGTLSGVRPSKTARTRSLGVMGTTWASVLETPACSHSPRTRCSVLAQAPPLRYHSLCSLSSIPRHAVPASGRAGTVRPPGFEAPYPTATKAPDASHRRRRLLPLLSLRQFCYQRRSPAHVRDVPEQERRRAPHGPGGDAGLVLGPHHERLHRPQFAGCGGRPRSAARTVAGECGGPTSHDARRARREPGDEGRTGLTSPAASGRLSTTPRPAAPVPGRAPGGHSTGDLTSAPATVKLRAGHTRDALHYLTPSEMPRLAHDVHEGCKMEADENGDVLVIASENAHFHRPFYAAVGDLFLTAQGVHYAACHSGAPRPQSFFGTLRCRRTPPRR